MTETIYISNRLFECRARTAPTHAALGAPVSGRQWRRPTSQRRVTSLIVDVKRAWRHDSAAGHAVTAVTMRWTMK